MARYIKRNAGTEIPGNLIFFDTESYEEKLPGREKKRKLTLRLWCATRLRIEGGKVTRRVTADGDTAEEFWRFVERHSDAQRTTWMFAHNLAFDATMVQFWEKLDDGYFTIAPLHRSVPDGSDTDSVSWRGRIVAERSPTYFSVRHGHRTYKMVDTCNYWPKSLALVAADYGLEKVALPQQWDARKVWLERCERDVSIIEKAVVDMLLLWQQEKCGVFQPTAAGNAYTNWRHTCDVLTPDGESVDVVTDQNSKQHEIEREAYYGGRFQCYFVGSVRSPVYHLDINSLYPYVMMANDYPRRFAGYMENPERETLLDCLPCYECCARVFIDSRHQTFPVRIDGIQYHAYGKFHTSLCGPELRRALESNSVSRIHCMQWYSRAPIFRRWVDYWYKRKLGASVDRESNPAGYEFAKLILNSLSGKFAQHSRRWEDVLGEYPQEKWGGWVDHDCDRQTYQRKRGIGRITQRLITEGEPPHAFPLISALIAAYGREYMRMLIDLCPAGSVYYMATDSIICSHDAFAALDGEGFISATELGKFKIQGTHNSAEVYSANHYKLDAATTCGGLVGKSIADGASDGRVETWDSLPGIINGGPRNAIVISESYVATQLPEHKGIIGEDGRWNPYCLIDLEDWRGGPPKGGYLRSHLVKAGAADSCH